MSDKQASRFFFMVPNYWGTGPSEAAAIRACTQAGGPLKAEAKKGTHFLLEFPAETTIEVSSLDGSWSASTKPIRLVSHKGLKPEHVQRLEALVSGKKDGFQN